MKKSRVKMTMRNVFWSYFSMVVSLIMQFASRTVFIKTLGADYLGVNGLFTNVLGLISFAELGIGTAMNFSLYKPVADGDTEKIKSYMYVYKWAYRIIAGIVAVLGLVCVPFLDYIIEDPGDVGNVRLYFLLFLFNTVTSYFVSYKYSLANAEQKSYIQTNTHMIVLVVKTSVQITLLLMGGHYLGYLIVGIAVDLIQKIILSFYLNKLYPCLKEKDVKPLEKEEKKTLITKIKALVIHKIGDVSVHQTDNIIISAFISLKTVGFLSNYNMLVTTVTTYINVLFNSAIGSLGNMVATESKEHQLSIFKTYHFISFWFYGFTAIALMSLLTPFVTLWVGEDMVLDSFVIALIVINYYFQGQRVCINNIRSAAGAFEKDKYVAFLQAIVNVVVSIILCKLIGLPGVFIGTVVQGLMANIIKPIVTHKAIFGVSSWNYFIDEAKYVLAVFGAGAVCVILSNLIFTEVTILRFILMVGIVAVVPNLIFFILFFKTKEFAYIKDKMLSKFLNKIKKKTKV